ncbi:MAG: carbohydrate porin [Pseudomonadota bacterium]
MRKLICTCAALATSWAAAPAFADESESAWTHDIVYTADVMGPVKGGSQKSGRYLDNLDVVVEADLGRLVGWNGATLHVYGLSNSGGRPNDVAQTLQGVDNIEVSKAKVHLYELWIQQDLLDGAASVRAGLYDLNSEFYTTEASDLLISPPFGIGSELASTGPNGPSIFPLTSVAARVRLGGETGLYGQAAVLSAKASSIDGDNVQLTLDRGAILIAEAGHVGRVRVAGGAWTYTARQDDIRDVTPAGDPRRSDAYGAYVLGEGRIAGAEDGSRTTAFARVGLSDGDTSPFSGGWQAGLRWDQVFESRPDSAISVGLHQGRLSKKFRANGRDDGLDLGKAESGLEITYSDTIGRLSIQPDLQVIHNPGGEKNRRKAVIAGIRFTIDLD